MEHLSVAGAQASPARTARQEISLEVGRLHVFEPTHRFSLADLDHAINRHLASVLSVACAGGSPAVARSMLRHNRGGNTLWPDDPSQLLPHGTEESLRGITQRSEETQHT